MNSNSDAFKVKYPWAASRTIAVSISDEHPFIANAYRSAKKHHLVFRQKQFQTAYLEQLEKGRRSILKKNIEMNDRNAISLRISAATSTKPFLPDKHKKTLSQGGVRRWIEEIDETAILEGEELPGMPTAYDTTIKPSI